MALTKHSAFHYIKNSLAIIPIFSISKSDFLKRPGGKALLDYYWRRWKLRRIPGSAYIRGFLIDALVSALPLKEAISIVDSLLSCIYSELECCGRGSMIMQSKPPLQGCWKENGVGCQPSLQKGSVTIKVLPFPTSDLTSISPLYMERALLTKARTRPFPSCVWEVSPW